MKPGQGIKMFNNFPASHHGSGPVDNYSKDTRRGMDADVGEGKLIRYNFEHCYDWCVKEFSKPSGNRSHLGTVGANGDYLYRAYSDGTDENPRNFHVQYLQGPYIPKTSSFQGLTKSMHGEQEFKSPSA